MKYTIPAIDQRAALALGNIDLIDCHLLQWLFYCKHGNARVSWGDLFKDYPLIAGQLKAVEFGQRLVRLEQHGYLHSETDGHPELTGYAIRLIEEVAA